MLPPLLSPERGGLNDVAKVLLTARPPPVPPPPPQRSTVSARRPAAAGGPSAAPHPSVFQTGSGTVFGLGDGPGVLPPVSPPHHHTIMPTRPRSPFSRPKGSAQVKTNRQLLHQSPANERFPTNEPPPPMPDKYVHQLRRLERSHTTATASPSSPLPSGGGAAKSGKGKKQKKDKETVGHGHGGGEDDGLPPLPAHRGLPTALLERRHMAPTERAMKPLVPDDASPAPPAMPSLVPTTTTVVSSQPHGHLPPMLSPQQAVGVAGVVEVLQRLDRGQRQALREQRRQQREYEVRAMLEREGMEFDPAFENPLLFGAASAEEDAYVRLPWMVPRASSASSAAGGSPSRRGVANRAGLAGVDGNAAAAAAAAGAGATASRVSSPITRPVSIIRTSHSQFSASASMVGLPEKEKEKKEEEEENTPRRFLKKGGSKNKNNISNNNNNNNGKQHRRLSVNAVNSTQTYALEFTPVPSPAASHLHSPQGPKAIMKEVDPAAFSSTAAPAEAAAKRVANPQQHPPHTGAAAGISSTSYGAPYDEELRLREFLKNAKGEYDFYDDTDLSDTLRKQRKRIPPLRYYLPSRVLSNRPRDPATGLFVVTPPVSPHSAGITSFAGVSATSSSVAGRSPEVSPRRRGGGGEEAEGTRERVSSPRFQRLSSLLDRHRTRVSHRGIYHLDKKLEEWRRPEEVRRREWMAKKLLREPLQLRDEKGSPTSEMGKYERMIFEEQEQRLEIVKEQVRTYWAMVCEWRIEKEYVPKLVSWV